MQYFTYHIRITFMRSCRKMFFVSYKLRRFHVLRQMAEMSVCDSSVESVMFARAYGFGTASLDIHQLADCKVPGPASLCWHCALPRTKLWKILAESRLLVSGRWPMIGLKYWTSAMACWNANKWQRNLQRARRSQFAATAVTRVKYFVCKICKLGLNCKNGKNLSPTKRNTNMVLFDMPWYVVFVVRGGFVWGGCEVCQGAVLWCSIPLHLAPAWRSATTRWHSGTPHPAWRR